LLVLRDFLANLGMSPRGNKAELVNAVLVSVERGEVSIRDVFGTAPKTELRSVCDTLETESSGTIDDLLARIDRLVRFSPLGDAKAVPAPIAEKLTTDLAEREQLLILELHARLARRARGSTTMTLGELIARFGRHRAEYRARASAARELGDALWRNGLTTNPDLTSVERSPGIEAQVSIAMRADWGAESQLPPSQATSHHVVKAVPLSANERTGHAMRHTDAQRLDPKRAELVAKLGMSVSKADAIVRSCEVERITSQGAQTLDLSSTAARGQYSEMLERLKTSSIDIVEVATEIAERFTQEERDDVFVHLFDVAMADGVIVTEEQRLLKWLEYAIRPTVGLYDSLMDSYRNGATSAPPSRLAANPAPSAHHSGSVAGGDTQPSRATPDPSPRHIDDILNLLFSD
jgi:uncharacterized tellurite resistance protein B-like protein